MKKVIRFSKAFLPATILSIAIIAVGIITMATKGLNLGLDFKPGLIEEIKIAPPAISLTYTGPASVSVLTTTNDISLVVTGVGAENTTSTFTFVDYPTVGDMAKGFETIAGVKAVVKADANTSSRSMLVNSQASTVLGSVPYIFHYADEKAVDITADDMREVLSNFPDASVKAMGKSIDNVFQIRIGDDETTASEEIQKGIMEALVAAYGKENIAVIKADFIGSSFSSSLAIQSILMVCASLVLIWIYATIRFKWDFALGSIIAIIHDALIMFSFIAITGIEFNAVIIAAILTIIGYSINDTVVVLDRVRENVRKVKVNKFVDILDISQTEILNRTIITTITTLLAVVSLYVFTSGSMKDFALALIVGMISGIYSTIYIAGAFIALTRRNWKPSDEEKKTQTVNATELV